MSATSLMQSLMSLLLVVGSIFVLAWLLRRVQRLRPRAAGGLRIHGGLSLGQRERVLWLEAGGRHLLIGVAPGRVNTLHVFDEAPQLPDSAANATAAAVPATPNFNDLLRRALGRGE